ncbi:NAD-P-binding protein [Lenzites betulinus]|nr:NAD-P-binding protein [Lenzites betulinus]
MPSTTTPSTWFIAGASRGIGFEIVRQLVASPDNLVIAACRTPEKAFRLIVLQKTVPLGRLHITKLDTSDFDSIRASAKDMEKILGEKGLDYLVNNAAIGVFEPAFEVDPDQMMLSFRTNTVGPALLSRVALPFLERGREKKILHISSSAGSLATAPYLMQRPTTSYSMSKSALNMLATKQKLERPDLIIVPLCPGYVKTDLSGPDAPLEPEESIRGILKIVKSATLADSGKYVRYNGELIPW